MCCTFGGSQEGLLVSLGLARGRNKEQTALLGVSEALPVAREIKVF